MQTFHGYLLRITEMPSGDAFCKIFSREEGVVSVICRKYRASKKRKQHLDFFRLLELSVQKNNVISSVSVRHLYDSFEDYDSHLMGFEWLELVSKTLPEGKASMDIFESLSDTFSHLQKDTSNICDLFFRMKLLQESGHLKRFDLVRTDTYFQPKDFSFFDSEADGTIFLPNSSRQLLECIRRSDLPTLCNKKESFPLDLFSPAKEVLQGLEEYHLR